MSDAGNEARALWAVLVDYAAHLPDHGASSTWGPDRIAAALDAAEKRGAEAERARWVEACAEIRRDAKSRQGAWATWWAEAIQGLADRMGVVLP